MDDTNTLDGSAEAFTELSLCVVTAVANAENVAPVDLEPLLSELVDPVMLDRLFEPTAADRSRRGSVSFRYRGYDVTVHSSGAVELS